MATKIYAIMIAVEDGDVDTTDIDIATYVAGQTGWPRRIGVPGVDGGTCNFEITDVTTFNEDALKALGCQELLDIIQNDPE